MYFARKAVAAAVAADDARVGRRAGTCSDLVRWGPVLVAGLTIASITYGGLLGVFLLGTWNRRANETGALVGFAAGIATMIAVTFLTPLAFTWYVLVGTIVTFATGSMQVWLAAQTPRARFAAAGTGSRMRNGR